MQKTLFVKHKLFRKAGLFGGQIGAKNKTPPSKFSTSFEGFQENAGKKVHTGETAGNGPVAKR